MYGVVSNLIFSFPGSSGSAVQLMANYFEVNLAPNTKIFQYHVDFKPYIENIRVKFALIAQAAESVGSKLLFDGGILYLSRVLPKDVRIFSTLPDSTFNKILSL